VQPSLGSGLATLTPHASRDEMMHFFGCLDLGLSMAGVSSVAACSGMKVIESSSPLGNLPSGFLIPFRWLERVDCHLSLSHAER
jgi:hypothetical protein